MGRFLYETHLKGINFYTFFLYYLRKYIFFRIEIVLSIPSFKCVEKKQIKSNVRKESTISAPDWAPKIL